MTFNERSGDWRATFGQPPVETHLAGDAAAPFPMSLAMAKACEGDLNGVLARAVAYITDRISDSAKISGEPDIEFIEFRLNNYGQHNEFEVFFSDSATYVLWSVRFHYGIDLGTRQVCLSPVGFARRSW
jgi:hypothetical protein